MTPLTEQAANEVWDLLVELGGASQRPDERSHFVWYQTNNVISEWRFQGLFGFGGKFYRDFERWRVGYYIEDETPERSQRRDEINARLKDLCRKHLQKESQA